MNTKTLRLVLLLPFLLASCSGGKSGEFIAEGTITDASGQVLYLESTDTDEPQVLDSVTLDKAGHFSFRREGHSYPSFFRLRLGESFIPFTADSTTRLSLSASGKDLFSSYKIKSGDKANEQIREITLLRSATDKKIEGIISALEAGTISQASALSSIDSLSSKLKEALTDRYIYSDPRSPAAYFALFQSYKGGTYFSVDSPGDDRAFAAVGTAYEAFYPNAPYTPLLKQAALRSVALARARRKASQPDSLATRQVEAVAFPEIQLKDQQGQLRSLRAEVAKGRPVLVSFTSYAAAWSPALVAELRRLQSAHPDLLIFEVSLDQDAYLWKNASRSLPWISTQDLSREAAVDYNVQSLPSFFSIRGTELRRLDEPADILR